MAQRRQASPTPADLETAGRLHSAAIHLLRRLRTEDAATGLTAPKASALSVVVFAGPLTLGQLATAEQVRPPTITRLVQELERAGLVVRVGDSTDRRIQRVRATARGRTLLEAGRDRRVARLAQSMAGLTKVERRMLAEAAELVERLSKPEQKGIATDERGKR